MFEIIEIGTDAFGRFEIAKNHLTSRLYKRVTFAKRGKIAWTDWYAI